ncbi:hypothetical protein EZ313_19635 [Ramlibacter henchirensis]|uniref:DNA-binding protein n=1 Tax=Ramlibacter henchirensis TaxID=204072 RepID=A0A4Z0BRM4_9BURK|nr:hypothetical protein [Ramlibacter henchirensis]TFZ00665.1 hypothetical protein EZ313_19635 [Ramlibacter henchirensis]
MQPHTYERAAGHDPRLADEPFPSTPGFWPVRQAAAFVGLSVNGLVAGIENHDIPVVMRRIGRGGKRWVNVEQLRAWVAESATPASDENLF